MSSMQIHTPEDGWEKRWLKEGTKLVATCPGALIIYLLLMPISGLVSEYSIHVKMPPALSFPINTFVECIIGGGVVLLMSREFYRKEGFPTPKLKLSHFQILVGFSIAISTLMLIFGVIINILSVIILAYSNAEIPPQAFDPLKAVVTGYKDIFTYVVVFFFCGHSLPILAASGMDEDENRLISKMMTEKIQSMMPRIVLSFLLGWFAVNFFMPFTILAGPIFIGIAYVASREMIGGPGAKDRAREESLSALPQGA